MSINNIQQKIKHFINRNDTVFIASVIILVAFASFGLGRLSKIHDQKEPVRIENPKSIISANAARAVSNTPPEASPLNQAGTSATLVASKNGTKYHFPWCPGAQRIKEANKIVFHNRTEAEQAGYTPAANCKGL